MTQTPPRRTIVPASSAIRGISAKSLPETKLLNGRPFLVNATAVHAVGRRSRPKDDDDGMDDRGPAPLRASHPGNGAAGHARPPRRDDRRDQSAIAGRPAAGLVDPGHAAGPVARGARRPRLAAAASGLAAAPDRGEPPHGLAAARGAGPGAGRPGRLPPPRGRTEAAGDGGGRPSAKAQE